jgi:hypothetical protein
MSFRINDLVGRVMAADEIGDLQECGDASAQRCPAPSCVDTKATGSTACAGGTSGCAVPTGTLKLGDITKELYLLLNDQ